MPDIVHDFPIKAPAPRVFRAVSVPAELDQWWTKESAGEPRFGAVYALGFGPQFAWRARVTACVPPEAFELELVQASDDWLGTQVGFHLEAGASGTQVRFHHTGWPAGNEHYRISCYCWAMYLRVLKRYVERGEAVPYEHRLDV